MNVRPAVPTIAIGKIFDVARGGSPRPIERFLTESSDGLNWVKISDATASGKFIERTKEKIRSEGLSKTRAVAPGDFLLTNSMSFGRPYIMATHGCIHDGWLVLKPRNRQAVDTSFFYHLLGSPQMYGQLCARAGGSTVKNLNSEIVASVEVPLPPIQEQRRIAAILDKADALRRTRKRALVLLDTLTQSIFMEMFGDLRRNPKGWNDVRPLEQIASVGSGITKGRKPRGPTKPVPYMAVANVQRHAFDLSAVKTIDATDEEIDRYRLASGDLLLTEGGDPDKLGRGTIWRGEIPEVIHQNHIFRVRVTSADVDPIYLSHLIGDEYGRTYFLRSAKQTTGIASINKSQLSAFPVPVPPTEIQAKFASALDHIAEVRRAAERATADTESLFASLQSRAFTGQL